MSMFAGLSKSMNMGGEPEAPTFNLGATGEKFNLAANKLANGEIPTFTEESAFAKCCPNLTFRQRVYGFAGCAGFGWCLSLMGTLTLIGGPTSKNITAFAVLYVIGNVIALCATGFLLGPKTQCQKMWHVRRRYTTAFYLIMLIIVFSVAVAKQNVGIVIVLLIIEVLAATWYAISYIPFGRKMVIAFLRRTICKPCFDVYDASKGAGGGAKAGGGMSMASQAEL